MNTFNDPLQLTSEELRRELRLSDNPRLTRQIEIPQTPFDVVLDENGNEIIGRSAADIIAAAEKLNQ